jgi:glucosamine--fructose-6-phosphate aminotransferase (isomerizing)
MCGIVGYLGNYLLAKKCILSGLKLLQNRGYDSAGVSIINEYKLKTVKYASTNNINSIDLIEKTIKSDNLEKPPPDNADLIVSSIGHTRWATHGRKTDENAHPHHDNKNRISLVHNGIIENYETLKSELIQYGYSFNSQTDSEIISVLIGKYLDDGFSMHAAVENTISRLTGTWALVIINSNYPNKIWITRNGSPLLLGFEDEFIMIASEQLAFNNYVNKYIVLNNNDLIEITKDVDKFDYSKNLQHYVVKNKINEPISLTPGNYDHWMIKEIMEQPDSIIRAINNGGRILDKTTVKLGGLENYKTHLIQSNHLIILGCGTSYHAGLWALDIFKRISDFDTVSIYDGAEFQEKDIPKKGQSVAIILSQSGETKDLHSCLKIINKCNILSIGVVNVADSLIARETLCGVYLNAGREVAVASTKSFTNQCIILSLIALWFSQNRNNLLEARQKIIEDIYNLYYQVTVLFNKENIEKIKTLVQCIKNSKSMFLLGKGNDEAIAKEASLKLKEVTYIHAEGYSSSSLKHGPFGLIEQDMPIIILDTRDEFREKNNSVYQEVLARGAIAIKISNVRENDGLTVEDNKTFSGILANINIQLLSYYCAIEKGLNPDFPRNLAKVVTVD